MTNEAADILRKAKECDCIAKTNAFLAPHNAEVLHNIFGTPRALVTLTKVDEKKRGKVPLMQASFCPFCGTPYPEPEVKSDRAIALAEAGKS